MVAPAVLQDQLVKQIDKHLHRSASVDTIEINPYALSLSVQGFELADTDGTALVSFDEFAINLQLSSLFRWAWTFAEIRLDSPQLFYERFDNGDSRLDQLLSELTPTDTTPAPISEGHRESTGLPRLLVHSLVLNQGQATLIDRQPETPIDLALGPINIAVEQLSTLPNQHGQQQVAVQLPAGGQLSWQGSIGMSPFTSSGTLLLDNFQLQRLTPYLASQLAVEDFTTTISSQLNYQVSVNQQSQLKARIESININLDEITLTGLTPSRKFISIPNIALKGGSIRFPEQTVSIQRLAIDRPELQLWLDQQGSFSRASLLRTTDTPVPKPPSVANQTTHPNQAAPPALPGAEPLSWQIALDEFSLHQGKIGFVDQTTSPVANVGLTQLNLELTNITNNQGDRFPFEFSTLIESNQAPAGTIKVAGDLGLLPAVALQATTTTSQLKLATLQPWINRFAAIAINGGTLNSDINTQLIADQGMTVTGLINLADLDLKESARQTSLGGWADLAVNDINLGLSADGQPQTIAIGQVALQRPFARIAIDGQGNTNLAELLVTPSHSESSSPATAAANLDQPATEMSITIGGISVADASLDFSDLSLPLPFATVVTQLNGSVSPFNNSSKVPTQLNLQGQVNQYGSAQIAGSMSLFEPTHATDISLQFLNLEIARVSPYSAEFAGRKIDQGKLDLDLNYGLHKGSLNASNHIQLRDLKLGDKIHNPDAANLPLGIAVALLKDSNGLIDIKLPITGDLNNPEFKVGPVIWKAFAKLITKVATSPFQLLGNLIGVDSDDLGQLRFHAGQATLTPPELEKVAQLQQALLQRPNLVVEISGKTDASIDRPALTLTALQTKLLNETGKQNDGTTTLLDRDRKSLEKLFKQTFPDIKLRSVRKANKFAPADDPEGKAVFDESAYISDLSSRLLASIRISDQQLLSLAQLRAQTLKNAFIADAKLAEARVRVIDPEQSDSGEAEWVIMELKISH